MVQILQFINCRKNLFLSLSNTPNVTTFCLLQQYRKSCFFETLWNFIACSKFASIYAYVNFFFHTVTSKTFHPLWRKMSVSVAAHSFRCISFECLKLLKDSFSFSRTSSVCRGHSACQQWNRKQTNLRSGFVTFFFFWGIFKMCSVFLMRIDC